jgi:hypothetical protein
MQGTELSAVGVVKFFTKEELKRHLKLLVEQYQAQGQKYGDQLGGLLRTLEQEKSASKAAPKEAKESKESKDSKDSKDKNQSNQRAQARGWVKMGSMLVNVSDPGGAMAEVLYQLHEDVKAKLVKSTEALKSFDELSNTTIPEAGLYYLQMKNGIPERIVVDLQTARRNAFNFSADFKLV